MVRGGLYDGEKTKGLLLLLAQEAMATVVCRPPIVFQAEGRARAVSVARAKREGGDGNRGAHRHAVCSAQVKYYIQQ
jgi:hypothetical protein